MDKLIEYISSIGFPIVVALFFMLYFNKTLKELTSVLSKNNELLARICEHLNIPEK